MTLKAALEVLFLPVRAGRHNELGVDKAQAGREPKRAAARGEAEGGDPAEHVPDHEAGDELRATGVRQRGAGRGGAPHHERRGSVHRRVGRPEEFYFVSNNI